MNKKKLYRCRIDVTGNNLFMTIIGFKNEVLFKASGGTVGMKGPRKRTSYAAELVGKRIGEWLIDSNNRRIILEVNGRISKNVRASVTGMLLLGIKIKEIVLLTKIAHNGVRKRKSRRK